VRDFDRDPAGPGLDFRGFVAAVQQAHKPDYADVLRRAARRRITVRAAGAALVAFGVAGGGAAVVVAGDSKPVPKVLPSPTPGPWRTEPGPGSRSPQPQPKFITIGPDGWDVAEPDVPLTGMWSEMVAGDLDHLYLEYRDCEGRDCTRMLAVSEDGGRTWDKRRMPDALGADAYTTILHAHGKVVVARGHKRAGRERHPDVPYPASAYRTSVDGGVTWRAPAVRTVDALPAGWPVFTLNEAEAMGAVDPATGDVAKVAPQALRGHRFAVLRVPPAAGIWLTGFWPSFRPGSTRNLMGHAAVSRDGGRTWTQRRLPRALIGTGELNPERGLTTADGRTLYGLEERGDSVLVHRSTDGGSTWHGRALVDLDGPVLSMLPTADGALLIEGPTATFRSTDGGRTFSRTGPSLGAGAHPVGGGYAIPTNNSEYGVWLSPDGARWWYVGRPDVP
jgi:hypothetical protein